MEVGVDNVEGVGWMGKRAIPRLGGGVLGAFSRGLEPGVSL